MKLTLYDTEVNIFPYGSDSFKVSVLHGNNSAKILDHLRQDKQKLLSLMNHRLDQLIITHGLRQDLPRLWLESLYSTLVFECPYFLEEEQWTYIRSLVSHFVKKWVYQAIDCDWEPRHFFSCFKGVPLNRYDGMGVFLIMKAGNQRISNINKDFVMIENCHTALTHSIGKLPMDHCYKHNRSSIINLWEARPEHNHSRFP